MQKKISKINATWQQPYLCAKACPLKSKKNRDYDKKREQRQTNSARSAPLKFSQALILAIALKSTLASIGIRLNLA
jgi:hypothetical protein